MNAPKSIYLQIDDPEDHDLWTHSNKRVPATWFGGNPFKQVRYIRADLHRAEVAKLKRRIQELSETRPTQ